MVPEVAPVILTEASDLVPNDEVSIENTILHDTVGATEVQPFVTEKSALRADTANAMVTFPSLRSVSVRVGAVAPIAAVVKVIPNAPDTIVAVLPVPRPDTASVSPVPVVVVTATLPL